MSVDGSDEQRIRHQQVRQYLYELLSVVDLGFELVCLLNWIFSLVGLVVEQDLDYLVHNVSSHLRDFLHLLLVNLLFVLSFLLLLKLFVPSALLQLDVAVGDLTTQLAHLCEHYLVSIEVSSRVLEESGKGGTIGVLEQSLDSNFNPGLQQVLILTDVLEELGSGLVYSFEPNGLVTRL